MSARNGVDSRRAAIFAIARWLAAGDFPDRLIADAPDHGFVMDLVYGCARRRRSLEWILSQCLRRMPDDETRAALLVGAFQLLHSPSIPPYAAIHATVEAAKIASKHSAGFVNAVLRAVLRRRDELLAALAGQPLGVRESHPDSLVSRWIERYGPEGAARRCALDNGPADTVVACLPDRDAADALAASFAAAGIEAAPHRARPDCLVLPHGTNPASLPGFAEGRFAVQDAATLGAVELLDVAPGMDVLDACAAPGGKAVQIAARLSGRGSLLALDLHADRLPPLEANFARFGLDGIAECAAGDAADAECEALRGRTFDRILADVPCSNTGVLRRRPDARWRFSSRRLEKLRHVQSAILRACFARLRPGGRLVYSTCSLEPEENGAVVSGFIESEPQAELAGISARDPLEDGTDGAYAAAIIRKG